MSTRRSIRFLPCGFAVAFMSILVACVDGPPPDPLDVTVDATSVRGSFVHGGTTIVFRSDSNDQRRATLHLDIDGVVLDIEIDVGAQRFTEDGHLSSLYEQHVASLLALRDALDATHPELRQTLQGALLVREADRFAEAPLGLTLEHHVVDYAPNKTRTNAAGANGCGDDGVTCLPGTYGSSYAVYDPGTSGTCVWKATTYGDSSCAGRCGAGCNYFDNDYTWDCLDHDRCIDAYGGSSLSGNVDCGDEFWDAADDYALTMGPYCWSGSNRTPPPPPPPPPPPHVVVSIAIAPTPFTIDRLQRVQLRAIGTYNDATTQDVTATATWTTSNSSVAIVTAGSVDGTNQSGAATITASVGSATGAAQVTVGANLCHVTINEVQAGGATAADEWIELYNGCTVAFDLTGWTLVYRGATAVGGSDTSVLSALAGAIQPGEFRLYASASAPAAVVAVASSTWTSGVNGQLQRTAAAVGLRSGPATTGALVDSVAYGTVSAAPPFAEGGTTAPALDNGRSVFRAPFDGRDSNSNAGDFLTNLPGAPTPKAANH